MITDTKGREYFVLLELENSMRTYEAVFGDLDGKKLVCVKRHIKKNFWEDGYYFCTYRPNYRNQKALSERDLNNKKLYPHSYLEVNPVKGRFLYRFLDDERQMTRAKMSSDNPWMGFMMGCCTCLLRCARFTANFKKRNLKTQIFVDQWRNTVKVAPNNDLLAALCIAYVFDKCQNQPMVTMIGADEDDYGAEDEELSLESVSSEEDETGTEMRTIRFADEESRDADNNEPEKQHNLDHLDDAFGPDDKSIQSERSKQSATKPELL